MLFYYTFDGKATLDRWIPTKSSNYTGHWTIQTPPKPRSDIYERMLTMKESNSYYALSTRFGQPIQTQSNSFIIQYEMRNFHNVTCSGGYLKLFDDPDFDPLKLTNETKQFIMFGPDKCYEKNQVAFSFQHKNPKTQKSIEKFVISPPSIPKDTLNHLYTIIIKKDGSFKILIDNKVEKRGNYKNSFNPSIIPDKLIPDSSVKKPEDWDDQEYIIDESKKKPSSWDDREFIPDPKRVKPPHGWLINEEPTIIDSNSKKPTNWDDELLGEWIPPNIPNPKCKVGCGPYTPPMIKNPKYKGEWTPPVKKNPHYKGPWEPPKIPNPDYFIDNQPFNFPPLYGVGFELWTVDGDTAFNNIVIADDEDSIRKWNNEFFLMRQEHQLEEYLQMNPTPTPTPTPKRKREPIKKQSKIKGLIKYIFEKWFEMASQSPQVTISVTIGIITIPLIMLCFYTRDTMGEEEEEDTHEKAD